MRQLRKKPLPEGFKKTAGNKFYTEDIKDEMMCYVLDLYPHKKQEVFIGKDGNKRRKELYKKVRAYFNTIQDDSEEYYGALGDGLKRFGKKAKEKVKKGLKKVGNVVKRGALVMPRGAALGLIRVNFRGAASKFNLLTQEGIEKIKRKWENLGGKADRLQAAIDAGKSKKPFICGKKCRAKAGKNPQLSPEMADNFLNESWSNLAGFDDVGIGTWIAAGGTVVGSLIKVVGDKSNYKSQIELAKINQEIEEQKAKEKKIDAAMSPQDQKLVDEIIKSQESSFDSAKAIAENPNLTAEEKTEALKQLKEDLDDGQGLSKTSKIGIGVVVTLTALGLLYYFTKNK